MESHLHLTLGQDKFVEIINCGSVEGFVKWSYTSLKVTQLITLNFIHRL